MTVLSRFGHVIKLRLLAAYLIVLVVEYAIFDSEFVSRTRGSGKKYLLSELRVRQKRARCPLQRSGPLAKYLCTDQPCHLRMDETRNFPSRRWEIGHSAGARADQTCENTLLTRQKKSVQHSHSYESFRY